MDLYPRHDRGAGSRCSPIDGRETAPQDSSIRRALVNRLSALGLHRGLLPWLIRNLAAARRINPYMNLLQFNRRLHYLGLDELDLDYHTWQLALACLEAEGGGPATLQ